MKDSNISFLNRLEVIQNIYAVPWLLSGVDCDIFNLRHEFFEALNGVQSSQLKWAPHEPLLEFENDEVVNHLIQKQVWNRSDTEGNKHIFPSEIQQEITKKLKAGMKVVREVNPDLSQLIKLMIAEFPCLRKPGYGGGSISSLIGVIWLNPMQDWDEVKYGECIVHEWVHHSLFLEHMVRGVFAADSVELASEEALVTSAILHIRRSLDKAYHSAAVAVTLMYFHQRLDNEEMVRSFAEPTHQTVQELERKKHYLTPRGQEILSQMSSFLSDPDYEAVTYALSGSKQLG